MSDLLKMMFMGLLIATSFLSGVLTSNYQSRQIVADTKDIAEQVRNDLQDEIRRTDADQAEHRRRDALHICSSSIDHLEMRLDLRNIAEQAGLNVTSIQTQLRPEVLEICADTNVKLNGRGD